LLTVAIVMVAADAAPVVKASIAAPAARCLKAIFRFLSNFTDWACARPVSI
jgi:hypothetical protein